MNKNPSPGTRFKAGTTNNPKGRPPKGQSLADLMRKYLEESDESEPLLLRKERFVKTAYEMAVNDKDATMLRLIWSYIDGLPIQRVEPAGMSDQQLRSMSDEELNDELRKRGIDPATGLPIRVATPEPGQDIQT